MRVHHIALLTPDPGGLAAFYADRLGLAEVRRAEDERGLRAVWLDAGGTIVMVERGERRGGLPATAGTGGASGRDSGGAPAAGMAGDAGWDGVFFAVEPGSGPRWAAALGDAVVGRTAFTLYARDPDGNRFGVSSWPEPLG